MKPEAQPLVIATRRWVFRLVALTLPLSEPSGQLGAMAALLFFGLERPATGESPADRLSRRAAWLIIIGLIGWTLVGLVGAWTTGFAPRASRLNKIYMAGAIAAGAVLLPRSGPRELRLLLKLLVAGTAVAAAVALWQVLVGPFPGESLLTGHRTWMGQLYIPGTRERAGTGTLLNRLKMAEALLLTACALIAAIATGGWRRPRKALVSALLFVLGMLGLTFTKGSLPVLIMAAAAWWMLLSFERARRWLPTLIGLGLILGVFISIVAAVTFPPQPRIPAESPIAERRWLWQRGMETFGSAPWSGVGAAAYEKGSRPFIIDGVDAFYSGSHNQHLTQLAEAGVVGFVFWCTVWIGILMAMQRRWAVPPRSATDAALRDLGTLYVLALMPLMFVHDVLFHPGTAAMFWLSVGCLIVPSGATETFSDDFENA